MRVKAVPVNMLGEGDVVIGIESWQEIEPLKDEAHLVATQECSRGVAHLGEVVSIEKHSTTGRLGEPSDDVEQG